MVLLEKFFKFFLKSSTTCWTSKNPQNPQLYPCLSLNADYQTKPFLTEDSVCFTHVQSIGNNRTQLFVDDEFSSHLASTVLAPCKQVSNCTKTIVRLYNCAD